jgi:hypothetical protein
MAQRLSDFGSQYVLDYFGTKLEKVKAYGSLIINQNGSSSGTNYESNFVNITFTTTFDDRITAVVPVDIEIIFDNNVYDEVRVDGLTFYDENNVEIFFNSLTTNVFFDASGLLSITEFRITLNDVYST